MPVGKPLLILFVLVQAALGDLTTNLYAYYKLDEASSGTATDATPNGRTLSEGNNGTVPSTTGLINGARSFDGTTDFVASSASLFSPGSSQWFATMWVKPSTLTTQPTDASFAGKFLVPTDQEWLIFLHNQSTGEVNMAVETTTVVATTHITNTTSWWFVAGGWDGSNIKISINGEAFVTAAYTGPMPSNTGVRFNLAAEGGSQKFKGAMDEVGIWIGRCLTLSEVQLIYNGGAGLPYSDFATAGGRSKWFGIFVP